MPGPSKKPEIQAARAEAQQKDYNADNVEYVTGSSIRAEETPPRKSRSTKQMVDFKGFPLVTEDGNPLATDKQVYTKYEYGEENSPSVVLDSENFQKEGRSTANKFSKKFPAATPIIEQFPDTSEVARSLLGINRETTQQGLFGNVSTYGLDEKDWRVDGTRERRPIFWYRRPSSSGNYFMTRFDEDTVNSAIAINSMPSPFTPPGKPGQQTQLINPGEGAFVGWGQYINSVVALYLIKYMTENFSDSQKTAFNLDYLLNKYPPVTFSNGTSYFDELYWDKIWLDIQQNRFGADENYPLLPKGRAYNFIEPDDSEISLTVARTAALWGEGGDERVIISEADAALASQYNVAWDRFFFSVTRVYYPSGDPDNYGHYRLQTNPEREIWEDYFGLNWDYLRQDLKDWKFTIHEDESTVTNVERDLKLPYFVLSSNLTPDPTNSFTTSWPVAADRASIQLPTSENRIGGIPGIRSETTIKSIRSFRYQPGRISGFTYGSKASEIGAGAGTTIEWGVENDTDAYFFRLADGADFQIVRRSIIELEPTQFLDDAGYIGDATTEIIRNGYRQYETIIEQKNMNGDPLNGEGKSGYILDPDTVTMYKIEFGWYGAIGARFYAYIPQENGECRWVTLHTLVIENQLGQPCLGDPFFYFRYRLIVGDSSKIRVNQFLYKFGASYYIDGYDEGTLYSSFAKSKMRLLPDPKFTSTKTYLNAIDYTTLIGVKPKQYVFNRFGSEIYNKKEIFPRSISVYSQEDAEIKIIRQKACPEFAYFHQEGYNWPLLPESRRIKAKFSVKRWENQTNTDLGIDEEDSGTFSATMSQSSLLTGWRAPSVLDDAGFKNDVTPGSNGYARGDIRIVGDQLYQLSYQNASFTGNVSFKLMRVEPSIGRNQFITSQNRKFDLEQVYLPFTYAPRGEYLNGYDVEFDYFRRDQILLSNIDIVSDEFYIFFTGPRSGGTDYRHGGRLRIGFAWPDTSGTASDNILHPDRRNNNTWGIETPDDITQETVSDYGIYKGQDGAGNEFVGYDGQKFYEGLPIDFTERDYDGYSLWIQTDTDLNIDPKGLEAGDRGFDNDLFDFANASINVPGNEGGECSGLGFKAGREEKDALISTFTSENEEGTEVQKWYLESLEGPWPSVGGGYGIQVRAGSDVYPFQVESPETRVLEDGTRIFLLEIGEGSSPPTGLSEGETVEVIYEIIYIARIDKQNNATTILASTIASVEFARIFVQGTQGTSVGGVWVGQKTAEGIILDPLTPHASTVNVRHSGEELSGQNISGAAPSDGSQKIIKTRTQNDPFGLSTAPTVLTGGGQVDSTRQSIHSSPQKCGSFLSRGGPDPAGILTPSDYPIRWLTNDQSGLPLGTFYVSKNESVEISLEGIFNVNAESIVNSDDANLATIFIARSLNNHDIFDSKKEIYLTLNYDEQ